jgi:hypothetical protein
VLSLYRAARGSKEVRFDTADHPLNASDHVPVPGGCYANFGEPTGSWEGALGCPSVHLLDGTRAVTYLGSFPSSILGAPIPARIATPIWLSPYLPCPSRSGCADEA